MYTIGSGIYQIVLSRIEKYATCASDSYDDICGGNLYKHLSSDHDLGHYVTFTFNTDGIPVYKSSSYSFWPIYLLINELPYRMRYVNVTYIHAYCKSIKPQWFTISLDDARPCVCV